MFTLKAIMTVSLCLVFVVSQGKAEETKSLDLAVALVEVDGSASVFDSIAHSLVQQQEQQLLSRLPNLDPETLEKFKTLLLEELTTQKPDLLHRMAELYAKHFSQEDLQELVAFYQTDLGKKEVEAGIQMQDDLFRLGYQWVRTAIQQAARHVHARLKEEGIEL